MKSLSRRLLSFLLALAPSAALAGPSDGYVGYSRSYDVLPFDPVSLAEGPAIDLLRLSTAYPYDATITRDGTQVWIADATADEVIVIDRATDAILDRIAVGEYAVSVEFSPDGTLAFVGCRQSERLDVIDTATRSVMSSLPMPDWTGQIGVNPVTGRLIVSLAVLSGALWEVEADGSALLRTLPLGDSLWSVRVSPDGATA